MADTADTSTSASIGTTPVDSDSDGVADFVDLDSDGDGIPDTVESRPTAGYTANDGDVSDDDADGDGVIAMFDNNDGTSADFGGTFLAPENTDGSDDPDYLDTDSDNDGTLDTDESGLDAIRDRRRRWYRYRCWSQLFRSRWQCECALHRPRQPGRRHQRGRLSGERHRW